MASKTILVADDDATIRTVVSRALSREDYEVRATGTGAQLWRWVEKGIGDVVITDVVMPDANGLDLVPRIVDLRPELPVIVMSAQNTLTTAVKATEVGAYDYISKPFDLAALKVTVEQAALQRKGPALPPETDTNADAVPIMGRSPAMQDVFKVIARIVGNDLTLLITGESGTGKELIARTIHDMGRRSAGRFVALNMAAIPKDLIETELFGHEKGAFTGAVTRTQGKFALAQGGTLFLDEIGDMPLDAQTRLLRVLQEGEFIPIGAAIPIKTDVRVLAATHQNLEAMVKAGTFREDLYFRLNVIPMHLPPLRERLEDIPELALHFIRQLTSQGLAPKALAPDAIDALLNHRWPGNVRELQNLIRRLTALHVEDTITGPMVRGALGAHIGQVNGTGPSSGESLSQAVDRILTRYFKSHGHELPPDGLYDRILEEVERPLLAKAIEATGSNQLRTARLLGLNRNTLRKKLNQHQLLPSSKQRR
ncbi:MAG: nitrogen regulation protein NR(I) [Pseudomonadota bacterium]